MADDRASDKRRAADGEATVRIPDELLSILPPPAAPPTPERTPTPPPPGPAGPVPPPPPPDPVPLTPGRAPASDDPRRGGGALWLAGALVVVVLFVALCYVVVAQAEDDRPRGADVASAPGDTAATSAPASTTVPTPTTQDPAALAVVVLNGTPQVGWAGENVARLAEAGYQGEASDAAAEVATTTVYIADEGLQADGAAVATAVGLPDAPVTVRPEEPLGVTDAADGADVVVVLGADSLG